MTAAEVLSFPEDPWPEHERTERSEFWRRAHSRGGDLGFSVRDMGTDPLAWAGRWLSGLRVLMYGEERPARPWAALPWLTDHALRGHIDWPGL